MAVDRNSQESGAPLIFADRYHRAPERRAQDETHQPHRQRDAEQNEVVERIRVRQNVDGCETEIERLPGESAQAIVASGDGAPLKGDVIEHLPEGDGNHGEVDTPPTGDEGAQQRSGYTAQQHPAQQRERRARRQKLQCEAGAIRAKAEIRRVTE